MPEELANGPGETNPVEARSAQSIRGSLIAAGLAFLVSRGIIIAVILIAPYFIPEGYNPKTPEVFTHTDTPRIIDAFVRWDAVHYLSLAKDGYHADSNVLLNNTRAWPLYSWLIRLLGGWAGQTGLIYAGLLISNLAFFGALVLLHRLTVEDLGAQSARRTVMAMAVFPGAFFFSAAYPEALLVFLSVASFYAMRGRRWLPAAILGGLAALTRGPGVLMIVPFLWESVRATGLSSRRVWWPIMLSGFMPLGTLIFMAALWVEVGDPLAFTKIFQLWGPIVERPADAAQYALSVYVTADAGITYGGAWIGAFGSALFLASGVWLWRRRFYGYAIFLLATTLFYMSLTVPTGTGSMIRYLAPIFPAYVAFGAWGANRWFSYGYTVVSLVFLALATLLYAQWYWVG